MGQVQELLVFLLKADASVRKLSSMGLITLIIIKENILHSLKVLLSGATKASTTLILEDDI